MALIPTVSAGQIASPDWANAVAGALNFSRTTDISSVVNGSGWSVTAMTANYSTQFMAFHVNFQRSGSAITPNADGDISNEAVCTLPPALRGTSDTQMLSTLAGGRVAAGYYIPTSGSVRLVAVSNADTIATGETLSLAGFIFLGQ